MKISGIITEYNPFHLGHKLHLEKSKTLSNSDAIVCVMSGNFMQRGIPAILNKWNRASIALANGVDLIIELPTVFSISSAEFFSKGAISILNSLGVVDSICFGSESGSIKNLSLISEILVNEPALFKEKLSEILSSGIPYHKARSLALKNFIENNNLDFDEDIESFLNSSNNILGIEYIKSLLILKSNIKPLSFMREGSNYNDKNLTGNFSSATSIRESYFKNKSLDNLKDSLPIKTFSILKNFLENGENFTDPEIMFKYIKHSLITNKEVLLKIPDVNEGIDNKILKEIPKCNSLEEFILCVKSKRYTYTRINRILCNIFLGTYSYNLLELRNTSPKYVRILGLNEKGAKILKKVKKYSDIEIITKIPNDLTNPMIKLDIQATNCYSLISNKTRYNEDYLRSPIIYK